MKAKLQFLFTILLIAVTATAVIAGGDQNQGDKGKGAVNQHQVRNAP